MINKQKKINELKEISAKVGANIDLIQGAGGNTSLKENGILWVKASGCWLSDAIDNDIFVPIDNKEAVKSIKSGDISNISIKKSHSPNKSSMHPSIETALHALMPHKFVIHVHAVNTLSIAVLSNGQKYVKKLLQGINWAWIPYVMPGIELAREVQSVMKEKPDVLVLANHGLVIGGETAQQVLNLLMLVEEKMRRVVRRTLEVDNRRLLSIIGKSKYRLPKYKISHAIATDDLALKVVETGVLYPDHVVFLGPGPMNILSIDELEGVINKPHYVDNNPVIIVRDFGVVVCCDFSENAESMLYCGLLRVQPDEKLRYLTKEDEMDLMGWDAEKYRQSIQR
jgi:rhamnose utilization protein RhaD (predicted bifunctional aldolase and dehydrogenase)